MRERRNKEPRRGLALYSQGQLNRPSSTHWVCGVLSQPFHLYCFIYSSLCLCAQSISPDSPKRQSSEAAWEMLARLHLIWEIHRACKLTPAKDQHVSVKQIVSAWEHAGGETSAAAASNTSAKWPHVVTKNSINGFTSRNFKICTGGDGGNGGGEAGLVGSLPHRGALIKLVIMGKVTWYCLSSSKKSPAHRV